MNIIYEIPSYEISGQEIMNVIPLVSVKMITYNHKPYIKRAIKSILNQNVNFPFELVIGEDCSTDGTREIVEKYQKRYSKIIRIITSKHNVGGPSNGLRVDRACRGKYIAFCEGDDFWHHPLKLQKQIDFMEANPDVGLVHSGADTYYEESKRRIRFVPKSQPEIENDQIFYRILCSSYVIKTLTVIVRKNLLLSLIENNPVFFSNKYVFGDHQRWLLISRFSKIGYINESLATRTILVESATHSRDINKVICMLETLYDLKMQFWRKFHCPQEMVAVIRQKHYEALLGVAYNAMNRDVAFDTRRIMKKQGQRFTIKQTLFFLGASNLIVNIMLKSLMRIRQKVRHKLYSFGNFLAKSHK